MVRWDGRETRRKERPHEPLYRIVKSAIASADASSHSKNPPYDKYRDNCSRPSSEGIAKALFPHSTAKGCSNKEGHPVPIEPHEVNFYLLSLPHHKVIAATHWVALRCRPPHQFCNVHFDDEPNPHAREETMPKDAFVGLVYDALSPCS